MELNEGRRLFNSALNSHEEFNMDDCSDSIDCLTRASKLAFEKDTELEAKCEAFVGKIYYKGLVNLKKAKLHLFNALRLALTLHPKDVSGEAWHQLATKQLQEIREKIQKDEQEKIDAEKKKYMDMIKEDLTKIEAQANS